MAWLFSEEHLSSEEMKEAAQRIKAGENPNVSVALRHQALRALGLPAPSNAFSRLQLVGIFLLSVLFSPLVALAFWWGCRQTRPIVSKQSAVIVVLSSAVLLLFCISLYLFL